MTQRSCARNQKGSSPCDLADPLVVRSTLLHSLTSLCSLSRHDCLSSATRLSRRFTQSLLGAKLPHRLSTHNGRIGRENLHRFTSLASYDPRQCNTTLLSAHTCIPRSPVMSSAQVAITSRRALDHYEPKWRNQCKPTTWGNQPPANAYPPLPTAPK